MNFIWHRVDTSSYYTLSHDKRLHAMLNEENRTCVIYFYCDGALKVSQKCRSINSRSRINN